MQSNSTIDNHREIGAALDFLRQASVADGVLELDPRVVSGWVEMSLGALEVLVTAKRGKHADDKALKQTVEEHLEHAFDHARDAGAASYLDNVSGGFGETGLDDDNLPHYDHTTARIALLYTRKAIVEREKAEKPLIVSTVEQARDLFGDHSEMYYAAVGALQNRVTPVVQVNPTDKPQNSCKVHKLEHGEKTIPFVKIETDAQWYTFRNGESWEFTTSSTRRVDTDCWAGYSGSVAPAAKCVTPIANWDVYVDGHKLTNCKLTSIATQDIDLPGTFSNTTFGTKKTVTWPVDIPLTFAGVTIPQPKRISDPLLRASVEKGSIVGIALYSAKAGEFVAVESTNTFRRFAVLGNRNVSLGDFIYQRDIDPCHGCSYAKWPNKGPGYSERCDTCKLDTNRPGYTGK